MNQSTLCAARLVAISVLAIALGGCVVAAYPAPNRYYVGGVVAAAPPAPMVEEYGAPPEPGFVWIGGYWNWVGGRYEWQRGRWERPHPGERWVAHRWVHERDGWHLAQGHWERR